jgi:acetyl esterase/lipase
MMAGQMKSMTGVRLIALGLGALTALGSGTALPTTGPSTAPSEPPIRLWSNNAPGALGTTDADVPTLTPFIVSNNKTVAGFIVCPGGGYQHLSPREGPPVARWLNTLGINAFVLKYRIGPKYHHPVEIEDVLRAIRLVRSRAVEWHIDPHRIGIIGFSAGGHLASTAATHFDNGNPASPDTVERASSRPDLTILMYPVITMMDPYVHASSRANLLGEHPDPAEMELLSNERHVTPQTPPCFIVHTADDHTVPVQNSLMFAMALKANKVPFEIHIFEHGPHGFALGGNDPILSTWPGLAAAWLKSHGFAGQ